MKVLGAFIGGLTGAILATLALVNLWTSVIVPMVPAGEYHGLILLAVGLVLLMVGGGLAFFFVMLCATVLGGALMLVLPPYGKS